VRTWEVPQHEHVLEFMSQHRCAIAPQVQTLLRCSPALAARRLRELNALGYARSQRIFAGRPATWRITAAGLGAIGSPLGPPRLHLSQYAHDLGLGWLWLAARAGGFGKPVAIDSERSMRSHDARRRPAQEPIGVGLGPMGPRGGEQRHYPDLLLTTPAGRRIAFELELSGKGTQRLAGIMLSYAADRRIDAVLYLVTDRRLAGGIERTAREAGIGELVHVQLVSRSIQGAPDVVHRGPTHGPNRALASAAPARSRERLG
jgi:hypothetical protein